MQKTVKKFSNSFLLIFTIITLFSCNSDQSKSKGEKASLSLGVWKMNMNLNGESLPFNFTLQNQEDKLLMTILNADE